MVITQPNTKSIPNCIGEVLGVLHNPTQNLYLIATFHLCGHVTLTSVKPTLRPPHGLHLNAMHCTVEPNDSIRQLVELNVVRYQTGTVQQ